MSRQSEETWEARGPVRRGRALLVHGFTSSAMTWWQVGPALAEMGWDVTAMNLPGHGSEPIMASPTLNLLAAKIVADRPERPDILIGHSFGCLAILRRFPEWASTVGLEEPLASLFDDLSNVAALSAATRTDAAAVRADRSSYLARTRTNSPHWNELDIEYAARGLEQLDIQAYGKKSTEDPEAEG
jgi:pimeloyl-ACP methyl ester carboxylesterase